MNASSNKLHNGPLYQVPYFETSANAAQTGSKRVQSTELDIVGHCEIYLSLCSRWLDLDLLVIPWRRVPIRTKQLSTAAALLLSVLVVLVSREVILFFQVVSVLQLFCMSVHLFGWSDLFSRSYIKKAALLLAVLCIQVLLLRIFGPYVFVDPMCCVFF